MAEGATFHGRDGHNAEPAIGDEDFIGVEDVFAAQAALFDPPAGDDPFADDSGARAAAAGRGCDAVVVDEEDVGAAGGDEFGVVVEEKGFVEATVVCASEGVGVEPVIGGFQATEWSAIGIFADGDLVAVVDGEIAGLEEDEDARGGSGSGGRSVAGGDVDAGEAVAFGGAQKVLCGSEGAGIDGEIALGACAGEAGVMLLEKLRFAAGDAQAFEDGHAVAEAAVG